MVGAPQVVHDSSGSLAHKPDYRSTAIERRNFMSANIGDMYTNPTSRGLSDNMDAREEKEAFRKLFKAVERLGSSQMSWKERKVIENKNMVSLGGKLKKKDRMPITLGRNIIKKQQNKEQKLSEEGLIDHIQSQKHITTKNQKSRPENRALKISKGHFRNGMLDVKHILKNDEAASRKEDHNHGSGKGKRRGKEKQQKSKKRRRRN